MSPRSSVSSVSNRLGQLGDGDAARRELSDAVHAIGIVHRSFGALATLVGEADERGNK